MLPINEFLLWNNCNNNCAFCWQRKDIQSTLQEQLEAIELTENYIKTLKDSHILIIGGEIFSEIKPEIKAGLYELFIQIAEKMINNEIELCYINTNILYDMNSLLLPILSIFEGLSLIERIHFTTSADDYGRFINDSSKNLFYKNLKKLRRLYPNLYIICNIILTDGFCTNVLNDEFNIKEYKKKYSVDVNTIPYIKYGKVIEAPTRQKVMNTLLHLNDQDEGYLEKFCNNFLLGQTFHLHKYIKGKLEDVTADKSICGHSENFKKCYSDSDECFVCDCRKLKEQILL